MIVAGIQRYMAALGGDGCLFFDLLHASELEGARNVDPVGAYLSMSLSGVISPTCYVYKIARVVETYAGGSWECVKAGTGKDASGVPYPLPFDYVLKPGEHDVGRWEWNVSPMLTKVHFKYRAGKRDPGPDFPEWDPYGGSETVTNGALVARYILRRTSPPSAPSSSPVENEKTGGS